MKFKVTYYDYDADKSVTKDCVEVNYNTTDKNFSFIPVDNPVKIYKAVIIDHPIVSIHQMDDRIRICVSGYQCIKNGGHGKTNTIFESVREE